MACRCCGEAGYGVAWHGDGGIELWGGLGFLLVRVGLDGYVGWFIFSFLDAFVSLFPEAMVQEVVRIPLLILVSSYFSSSILVFAIALSLLSYSPVRLSSDLYRFRFVHM